jgi:transposase
MAVTGGTRRIVGGVDTHKDLHVAAVVDEQDRVIGTRSFATTRQGYRQMLAWMQSFAELQRIGIESTGSYGAGLLRSMQQAKVAVLEVTTPDKQDRRRRGKNDDLDAQNAAHAAFAGQRTVTPRSRDGIIESLRILMACRKTAVSARRVALQMIHNTIVCAPDGLRDQLRSLTRMQLVRTLASWRPDLTACRDLDSAYRIGLKSLARRYLELHDEIADLDVMIAAIVDELAPNLVARNSIGHIGAAQLLLTAGDNPERLRSEASFASLCGVSPVPASSGKTVRHRLNRGGDRAANSALHIIAIGRLRTDQRTKDYVARRIAEGHSKLDAIRARSATSQERSSPSSVNVAGRSMRRESPLDKQKGVRARNSPRPPSPARWPKPALRSPWTAAAAGWTTCSLSGCGARSSTRTSISRATPTAVRPHAESPSGSPSTTAHQNTHLAMSLNRRGFAVRDAIPQGILGSAEPVP